MLRNNKKKTFWPKASSAPSRIWRTGDKLTTFPPEAGVIGGLTHNWFPWWREWTVKIGNYGEEFKQQFEAGQALPFDEDARRAEYELRSRLSTDGQAFQLTEEQIQNIEQMQVDAAGKLRIANFKAACYEEWVVARNLQNVIIDAENEFNKEKIKRIVSEGKSYRDLAIKLYSDIFASMSESSQKLVRNWRSKSQNQADDGTDQESRGISVAEAEADWFWLFVAARETHVRKLTGTDSVALAERQQSEIQILRNSYHSKGLFTRWVEKFEDQVKIVESLDYVIPDVEMRICFMKNLNKEIFATARADWENTRSRDSFPDNFEELKIKIFDEYTAMSERHPEIVARVERPKKDEASFAGKESEKAKCDICGKNHRVDDCSWRNKDYPIQSNKAYYERSKKRDAAKKSEETKSSGKGESKSAGGGESKWDPIKGTIAKPPVKKEGSNRVVEITLSPEQIEERTVIDEKAQEACYRVREHIPDEIVFVYDTASTSGALVPGFESALRDTYHEETQIVGQGGGKQLSTVAGVNTFGRFRQLPTAKDNINLISHAQAEKNWQLIHPRPGYMRLREWPWSKIKTGEIWHLYSDEAVWGDPFLRLIISKDELPELLASGSNIEGCFTMYEPTTPLRESDLSSEEIAAIDKVEAIHLKMSHTQAPGLIRIIKSQQLQDQCMNIFPKNLLDISAAEVELWGKYRGRFCSGCVQGRIKSHSRVKSTAVNTFAAGEAIGGDLIFIDGRFGKLPSAVLVDMKTGYTFVSHLADKSSGELLNAVQVAKGHWGTYKHVPSYLFWDREPGIESILSDIQSLGMLPKLKAAGQHVGKVEVTNRLIRETARSVKCGVYDMFGYKPPIQWNRFLVLDSVDVINRRIPVGYSNSPYELFTGLLPDRQRDFRVDWGHPVIVKKPSALSANLDKEGFWSVPVRRYMNGQGTILFYIVQTKSYRHALKFSHAKIPAWVIASLQDIPESQPIRFDPDDEGPPPLAYSGGFIDDSDDDEDGGMINPYPSVAVDDALDVAESLQTMGNELSGDENEKLADARRVLTEAYRDLVNEPEPPAYVEYVDDIPDDAEQPGMSLRGVNRELRSLQLPPEYQVPEPTPDPQEHPEGLRRSTRDRKPAKLINIERFNICVEEHFILFEQALRTDKKDAAIKALDKELDMSELKRIWDPVFEEDLSDEQKEHIIDSMTNFVEKTLASGGFDKFKVRLLARGDQQTEFGETSSPVCRIESVFFIAMIAALLDLEVFTFDVASAYLNTKMGENVTNQWLLLPKHVSRRLVERDPERYAKFLRADKKILVHMNSLTYGYKEAALGWYLTLMALFDEQNYLHMPKDTCFLYKLGETPDQMLLSTINVDDGFAAATRGSGMKEKFLDAVRSKFEITLREGDKHDYLGMSFEFHRGEKAVSISQRQYVDKLVKAFGVMKTAKTPALQDLFEENPDSPMLKDQLGFMSINSSCNYAATRTFPELLPCASTLASRYYKATERDYEKCMRMIEYMNGQPGHELYLKPKSLRIVGYADASYGERSTGHSQTGGCVGVEGYSDPCLFIFMSSKQPVVAKSSCYFGGRLFRVDESGWSASSS